ncbi:MAG: peptide chain release factor N(5)-glutamine methyltransferase [Actinomycetota bacterium]
MTTWRELRVEMAHQLGSDRESRFLIEEASGHGASEWVEIADTHAQTKAEERARAMCERRRRGEPLQYILGGWSFRGFDLMVDPRVLIPRPETEWVVEIALAEAQRVDANHARLADLGTGSGAIAISLARAFPKAEVWATDASDDALAVARANVAGNAISNIHFGSGSWYEGLPVEARGDVRLIVSNPPYVAESEVADLPAVVADYEPRAALVAGPTGLEALAEIIAAAPEWLTASGTLVCEIAPHQADAVTDLARVAGFSEVFVRSDLTARPRVLVGRRG